MKIYFSHPTKEYKTDQKDLALIMEYYPKDKNEIINPKDIKVSELDLIKLKGNYFHFKEMMRKYYLPKVRESDLVIYSGGWSGGGRGGEDSGYLGEGEVGVGEGVRIEINEAIKNNISVRDIKLLDVMGGRERIEFYDKNPNLKWEMIDWFKVDKGGALRAVAMRPFVKKIKYAYRNYKSEWGYALQTLDDYNFNEIVSYARTVQYLPFIYDKEKITKNQKKTTIRDCTMGIAYVIDIDMPETPSSANDVYNGKRADMLTLGNIEYMKKIVGAFKKELSEINEWDSCKVIFSGNGVQIKLEDFYGDSLAIYMFEERLIGLVRDVIKIVESSSSSSTSSAEMQCKCHYKHFGWNTNMKPPNTFHFSNNRLTLLLDKNRDDYGLDLKDLMIRSNPYSKIYNSIKNC